MTGFLLFVCFIFLVFALRRAGRAKERLDRVEPLIKELLERLARVEKQLKALEQQRSTGTLPHAPATAPPPEVPVEPQVVPLAPPVAAPPAAAVPPPPPVVPPVAAAAVGRGQAFQPQPVPPPPRFVRTPGPSLRERFRPVERRLVENWTGVLGAAVLIAGVAFLGLYAALRLPAIYRFLLVAAGACVLIGVSYALQRRSGWRLFARWLRSTGAALFLFACTAASAPGLGMQWVRSAPVGWTLLLAGLVVNLFLAYEGRRQVFASLHVVLSLIPLAILRPQDESLILASAVTLFGVVLGARARWERHQLVTLCVFWGFVGLWLTRAARGAPNLHPELVAPWSAAAVAVVVGALQYIRRRPVRAGPTVRFAVRAAIWLVALTILAIVPQSLVTLGATTLLSLLGILLARRTRTSEQLLLSVVGFSAVQLVWYVSVREAPLPGSVKVPGAAATVLITLTAILAQVRADLPSPRNVIALPARVLTWALGTVWLLVYSGGLVRGATFVALAATAFAIGRIARARGLRWVHVTDTLVAQGAIVAAVFAFRPFAYGWLTALLILLLQAALYLRVVLDEGEPVLTRVGLLWLRVCVFVLATAGLVLLGEAAEETHLEHAAVLLLGAITAAAAHLYFKNLRGESFDALRVDDTEGADDQTGGVSVLALLVAPLILVGLGYLQHLAWSASAALLVVGALLLTARASGSRGLAVAGIASMTVAHLLAWGRIGADSTSQHQLLMLVPMVVLAAGTIAFPPAFGRHAARWIAIYLTGISVGIAAFTLFDRVSPLVPGVLWLCLSLVALELANRIRTREAAPVLHLGYGYLAAFMVSYVLVIMQAEAYLGPVRARLLIEALALATLLYWWRFRPVGALGGLASWLRVHPLFLEAALVLLGWGVIVEAPAQWRPVVWVALALAILTPPALRLDARLSFYSVVFFWASLIDLVVVVGGFKTPSPRWYDQPTFLGAVAIVLQIAYLVRAHYARDLANVTFPPRVAHLAGLSRRIHARQPLWIYYPFFAAVALFIYWTFDESLLTLVWSVEAFAVFVLSIALREDHFRYMALAALAVCLVRLLLFDMAQSNLITRGIVFVGMGLLMLLMNGIYNRYKVQPR